MSEQDKAMRELLYKEESYRIVGACFTVYNDKGAGFLEQVYQECLEIELAHPGIPFDSQAELTLRYRGHCLKQTYVPDFVCFSDIILEIKAVTGITDEHRAQVINYLKATGCPLGLLVNFGAHSRLEYERIANTVANYKPQ